MNTRTHAMVVTDTNVMDFTAAIKAAGTKVFMNNEERFIIVPRAASVKAIDAFTVLEDFGNATPAGLQRIVGAPLAGYTTVDRIIEIEDDWFVRQWMVDAGVVADHVPAPLVDCMLASARMKVMIQEIKKQC